MGKHKKSNSHLRSKSSDHDHAKDGKHGVKKHDTKKDHKRSSSGVWTVREETSKNTDRKRRSVSPEPPGRRKRRHSDEGHKKDQNDDRYHKNVPRESQEILKTGESSDRKKRRNSAEDQTKDQEQVGCNRKKLDDNQSMKSDLPTANKDKMVGEKSSERKKRRHSSEDQIKDFDQVGYFSKKLEDNIKSVKPDLSKENQEKKTEASERKKRRNSSEDKIKVHDKVGGHDRKKSEDKKKCVKSDLPLEDRIYQIEGGICPRNILILNHPETVTIKGKCLVRSCGGTVSIFGHHIEASGKSHEVFSPESHSLLNIETINTYQDSTGDMETILTELTTSATQVTEIIKTFTQIRHPVVLLLEKLESPALEFVTTFHPFHSLLVSSGKHFADKERIVLENIGLSLFSDKARLNRLDLREFKKVPDWLSSRLDQDKGSSSPVITTCGGQNVGKSTLARYLINTTLNHVDELVYLECDIGQTEFTPPGCVSLTKLTQPLLGPPFTHHKDTLRTCFLGVVTPGDDPVHYMKCISYVYQKYKDLGLSCPLIVNTMGWNKGIGLCLFADTLRLVKPDLVVQIDSQAAHKNFPIIDAQFMTNTIGWTTDSCESTDGIMNHTLMSLNTPVSQHMESSDRYKSRDQRTLNLLAYLGACFSTAVPLPYVFNSLCPYEVPWKQVSVHVAHTAVPRELVMYSLNASIVALCVVEKNQIVTSEVADYPGFLNDTPVAECVGFGVVRAIDADKKVFYIVTPVPSTECSRINCLIRGSIEVPQQLMLNQKVQGDVPYVGYPKDVIGASSVKRRRHLTRRSRAANH